MLLNSEQLEIIKAKVRIININGQSGVAERETAIAWAMMVNGAIKYNTSSSDKLDLNKFLLKGNDSGYRPYHQQVEAWVSYKYLHGNEAAPVTFHDSKKAQKWLSDNKKNFSNPNGWNNVPNSVTDSGGALDGYGSSNHGWGLALDMNLGRGRNVRADSKEARWLEKNASKYGFSGLVTNKVSVSKGAAPIYKEMWHWEFGQ